MPLLPASLAIPPGGKVSVRHTCNGAAVFLSLTWSGLADAVRRRVLVPEGACLERSEGGATLPFQFFRIPVNRIVELGGQIEL
jgi:hypothetical protein